MPVARSPEQLVDDLIHHHVHLLEIITEINHDRPRRDREQIYKEMKRSYVSERFALSSLKSIRRAKIIRETRRASRHGAPVLIE